MSAEGLGETGEELGEKWQCVDKDVLGKCPRFVHCPCMGVGVMVMDCPPISLWM